VSARERNPFRPGNGIPPPLLAGREAALESFSRLLDENARGVPANLILYGLRGTGKTVLLQMFKQICEESKWAYVEREFNERYRDEESFAEAFLQDLTNVASSISLRKRATEFGKKIVDTVKPEEMEVAGISYKPFYKSKRTLLEDHLRNHLINNWKIFERASDQTKGLVFFYDEFHSVRDLTPNFPLASLLGALAESQRRNCKYILVASGLPNVKIYMKEAKTYVERMFRFQELGNLNEKDSRHAIEEPLSKARIYFEGDVTESLINDARGYPYFLQFYGYSMIEKLNRDKITPSDFQRVRKSILDDLDKSFFDDRFESASDFEQKVLLAMARAGEDNLKTSEIAKRLPHQDYQTILSSLGGLLIRT